MVLLAPLVPPVLLAPPVLPACPSLLVPLVPLALPDPQHLAPLVLLDRPLLAPQSHRQLYSRVTL